MNNQDSILDKVKEGLAEGAKIVHERVTGGPQIKKVPKNSSIMSATLTNFFNRTAKLRMKRDKIFKAAKTPTEAVAQLEEIHSLWQNRDKGYRRVHRMTKVRQFIEDIKGDKVDPLQKKKIEMDLRSTLASRPEEKQGQRGPSFDYDSVWNRVLEMNILKVSKNQRLPKWVSKRVIHDLLSKMGASVIDTEKKRLAEETIIAPTEGAAKALDTAQAYLVNEESIPVYSAAKGDPKTGDQKDQKFQSDDPILKRRRRGKKEEKKVEPVAAPPQSEMKDGDIVLASNDEDNQAIENMSYWISELRESKNYQDLPKKIKKMVSDFDLKLRQLRPSRFREGQITELKRARLLQELRGAQKTINREWNRLDEWPDFDDFEDERDLFPESEDAYVGLFEQDQPPIDLDDVDLGLLVDEPDPTGDNSILSPSTKKKLLAAIAFLGTAGAMSAFASPGALNLMKSNAMFAIDNIGGGLSSAKEDFWLILAALTRKLYSPTEVDQQKIDEFIRKQEQNKAFTDKLFELEKIDKSLQRDLVNMDLAEKQGTLKELLNSDMYSIKLASLEGLLMSQKMKGKLSKAGEKYLKDIGMITHHYKMFSPTTVDSPENNSYTRLVKKIMVLTAEKDIQIGPEMIKEQARRVFKNEDMSHLTSRFKHNHKAFKHLHEILNNLFEPEGIQKEEKKEVVAGPESSDEEIKGQQEVLDMEKKYNEFFNDHAMQVEKELDDFKIYDVEEEPDKSENEGEEKKIEDVDMESKYDQTNKDTDNGPEVGKKRKREEGEEKDKGDLPKEGGGGGPPGDDPGDDDPRGGGNFGDFPSEGRDPENWMKRIFRHLRHHLGNFVNVLRLVLGYAAKKLVDILTTGVEFVRNNPKTAATAATAAAGAFYAAKSGVTDFLTSQHEGKVAGEQYLRQELQIPEPEVKSNEIKLSSTKASDTLFQMIRLKEISAQNGQILDRMAKIEDTFIRLEKAEFERQNPESKNTRIFEAGEFSQQHQQNSKYFGKPKPSISFEFDDSDVKAKESELRKLLQLSNGVQKINPKLDTGTLLETPVSLTRDHLQAAHKYYLDNPDEHNPMVERDHGEENHMLKTFLDDPMHNLL